MRKVAIDVNIRWGDKLKGLNSCIGFRRSALIKIENCEEYYSCVLSGGEIIGNANTFPTDKLIGGTNFSIYYGRDEIGRGSIIDAFEYCDKREHHFIEEKYLKENMLKLNCNTTKMYCIMNNYQYGNFLKNEELYTEKQFNTFPWIVETLEEVLLLGDSLYLTEGAYNIVEVYFSEKDFSYLLYKKNINGVGEGIYLEEDKKNNYEIVQYRSIYISGRKEYIAEIVWENIAEYNYCYDGIWIDTDVTIEFFDESLKGILFFFSITIQEIREEKCICSLYRLTGDLDLKNGFEFRVTVGNTTIGRGVIIDNGEL